MCSNATLVSHSWSAGLTAVSASPGLQDRSKEWRRGRVVFDEVEVACRIHGQRQVGSCPNVPVTVWHERCKLETKMRHAHLSTVSKLNAASPGLQGRSKEWHRGWVVFNEVEMACRTHGQRQVGHALSFAACT